MSRIQDIVINVRDVLADESARRWSDEKLIRYLNAGINEIVIYTKCLKERIFLELEENAALYDLSDYVINFLRVQYMNKAITAKTGDELDKMNPKWAEDVGTEVLHVVFNDLPDGWLRIYPRIENGLDNVVQNQIYGGLIDITVNDDIYKVPSFGDLEEGMEKYLVLHVVKKPRVVSIVTLDEEIELDSVYDKAIEYYMTAQALRADTDALNRQFGAEQLQLFNNYLTQTKTKTTQASNVVKSRTVSYQGFV